MDSAGAVDGGGVDSVDGAVEGAGVGSEDVVVVDDGDGDGEVEPAPSCIHQPPLSLIQ